MPLLGKGVLAIWNGVAPGYEAEFLEWHVKEHIPERVGVQGFLRGRRYVAVDGTPAYFNFYETETYQVLSSAPYLARLNDPTPWTRKVVSNFKDTSRTICDVAHSAGRGIGAWVETIQLQTASRSRRVHAPDGERTAGRDRQAARRVRCALAARRAGGEQGRHRRESHARRARQGGRLDPPGRNRHGASGARSARRA